MNLNKIKADASDIEPATNKKRDVSCMEGKEKMIRHAASSNCCCKKSLQSVSTKNTTRIPKYFNKVEHADMQIHIPPVSLVFCLL